jgi:hypothetical protein
VIVRGPATGETEALVESKPVLALTPNAVGPAVGAVRTITLDKYAAPAKTAAFGSLAVTKEAYQKLEATALIQEIAVAEVGLLLPVKVV